MEYCIFGLDGLEEHYKQIGGSMIRLQKHQTEKKRGQSQYAKKFAERLKLANKLGTRGFYAMRRAGGNDVKMQRSLPHAKSVLLKLLGGRQ